MGRRISLGWRLTKVSLSVVRQDSALAVLALLGAVLSVTLGAAPFALSVWAFSEENDVLAWLLLAVTMYLVYFAAVFAGVAIACAAATVLEEGDATVGASLRAAARRLGPIVSWAIVGATVNLLFTLLRDRLGTIGLILGSLGAGAWSLVTFLAIPTVAFEGLGPISTLKRSADLFRERWGEQLTGTFSINGIFVLLSLPAVALAIAGFAGGIIALGVIGVLVVLVIAVVGRAASATFGVVLYRYAATGEALRPFDEQTLRGVVTSTA